MKKIGRVLLVVVLLIPFTGCKKVDNTFETNNEPSPEMVSHEEMIFLEEQEVSEPNKTISFPKNALVCEKSVFITESGEEEIPRLSKIQLLGYDKGYYSIVFNGVNGIIQEENVIYYELDTESQYTLMLDVSEFNKDSKFYSFHTGEELGEFVIRNHINYLYIRIGGRGYGQRGGFYTDSQTTFFTNACDYFGIPYGFYFLDEALNEDEAIEEAHFVQNYFGQQHFVMHKLPIAIDVEYAYGKSRSDNSWNERTSIINRLIKELENRGFDCILYANGARIDTYIKEANCVFWTAMYPRQKVIPKDFYVAIIKEEEEKITSDPHYLEESFLSIDINMADTARTQYSEEYLNKVKAWQFTEDGASQNGIEGQIDLSLVDNQYFYEFCLEE